MKNSQQIAVDSILRARRITPAQKTKNILDNIRFIYLDGFMDKCYKVNEDHNFIGFKTSKKEGSEVYSVSKVKLIRMFKYN